MDMHNDISKKTVLVLLVLTLVISVVGTWTILSMPKAVYKTVELPQPQTGKVSVELRPPMEPTLAASSGKVKLNIAK